MEHAVTCAVCGDCTSATTTVVCCMPTMGVSTESFEMPVCQEPHYGCTTCILRWIFSQLSQGNVLCRCIVPECKAVFTTFDVIDIEEHHFRVPRRLRLSHALSNDDPSILLNVPQAAKATLPLSFMMQEVQMVSYKDRDFSDVSADAAEWMQQETRLCPQCNVLIFKDQGCNTVNCPCGQTFEFDLAALPPTRPKTTKKPTAGEPESETTTEVATETMQSAAAADTTAAEAGSADPSTSRLSDEQVAALIADRDHWHRTCSSDMLHDLCLLLQDWEDKAEYEQIEDMDDLDNYYARIRERERERQQMQRDYGRRDYGRRDYDRRDYDRRDYDRRDYDQRDYD
eukprot:m.35640 g.35640  ORF g.35640 m.35640 type:complete len:342 (+) comp9911_c0_seq1:192-1217(+)